jgi:regulation of enolase protein 1 (concanavalin A-like superfamily)
MVRILRLGTTAAAACLLAVATPAGADWGPDAVAWGTVIDPDEDCDVRWEPARVTIAIPGTAHGLSVELERLNAPRVVRRVEGDFVVQVAVAGEVHPGSRGTVGGRRPYQGAGLLIWQDEENYLRLKRAGLARDGSSRSYVNLELRERARKVVSREEDIPDRVAYLRLERRGGRLFAAVSPDGVQWRTLGRIVVDFDREVKVGVVAVNASRTPFTAELVGLTIVPASLSPGPTVP